MRQVSSVELERVCLEGVPSVLEAAAVGVPAPGGGPEQLVLFLVPRQQEGGSCREAADAVRAQCQAAIRARLNPLFKVDRVGSWPAVRTLPQLGHAPTRLLCRGCSTSLMGACSIEVLILRRPRRPPCETTMQTPPKLVLNSTGICTKQI